MDTKHELVRILPNGQLAVVLHRTIGGFAWTVSSPLSVIAIVPIQV